MIRPLSRASLVLDIVGAFLAFAVLTPASLVFYAPGAVSSTVPESVGTTALLIAAVVQCGALALGRLSPGLALAAAWLGAIIQMGAGLAPLPINLAILGVLFATAAWGSTRVFWMGLASVFLGAAIAAGYIVFVNGLAAAALTSTVANAVLILILNTLALGAPWLGGFGWRMVLNWRASREAQALAEAATAEEQERVRIARDMHDVVAHSLAVIIAQSDGARYASVADPRIATEALGTISQAARGALSDVRMLLTQLRHRQTDGPQPTLADLESLFAQVRQSGVDPRITVDPMPPGEPPAAVQLAVYRILQEALTNAIRHGATSAATATAAATKTVDVRLAWHADSVDVVVSNAVDVGTESRPGGHGIIGMRERAQLVGGTLSAEHDGAAFTVRATLPVGSGRTGEQE